MQEEKHLISTEINNHEKKPIVNSKKEACSIYLYSLQPISH